MTWYNPTTWGTSERSDEPSESIYTVSDIEPYEPDYFLPDGFEDEQFEERTQELVDLLNLLIDVRDQDQAEIKRKDIGTQVVCREEERKRLHDLGSKIQERIDQALALSYDGEPADFHRDSDAISVDANMLEDLVSLRGKIRRDLEEISSELINLEQWILNNFDEYNDVDFRNVAIDTHGKFYWHGVVSSIIDRIKKFLNIYGEWTQEVYDDLDFDE